MAAHALEGVDTPDLDLAPVVEFYGETFTLNTDVSDFAVMEFAEAASSGADGETMQGMAALLRFVVECIGEKDRARFRAHARRNRATVEALTAILTRKDGDRPTVAPSDSSDGRTDTALKLPSNSDGKVSQLAGRPDLRMVLAMDRQAQRSA